MENIRFAIQEIKKIKVLNYTYKIQKRKGLFKDMLVHDKLFLDTDVMDKLLSLFKRIQWEKKDIVTDRETKLSEHVEYLEDLLIWFYENDYSFKPHIFKELYSITDIFIDRFTHLKDLIKQQQTKGFTKKKYGYKFQDYELRNIEYLINCLIDLVCNEAFEALKDNETEKRQLKLDL